jgi:predicted TIM-barrel fold metal-dependent hydrolase
MTFGPDPSGSGTSPVVDADGHAFEPEGVWVERMDAKRWGDLVPRYLAEDHDGNESWYVGGVRRTSGTGIFGCSAGFDRQALFSRKWKYTEGLAAGWDPHERVRVLDEEGIDVTVLYPTMALLFGPLDPIPALGDVEFVLACQQAYNDWIGEYCATAPQRLAGMATVPIQDIDLACAEVERAVDRGGLTGVVLRSAAPSEATPFHHPQFDRFWSVCQDLDVTVAFHPATHTDFPNAVRLFDLIGRQANVSANNLGAGELKGGGALSHAVGAPVDAIVTLGRLLMGGVCERFPRLRFAFVEAGGGWLPAILHAMDAELDARLNEARWLSLKPSEYFRRQCWISFSPDDPTLVTTAQFVGDDRILWATDFPHLDGVYPGASKELFDTVAGLDPAARSRIAGGNALDAYGPRLAQRVASSTR